MLKTFLLLNSFTHYAADLTVRRLIVPVVIATLVGCAETPIDTPKNQIESNLEKRKKPTVVSKWAFAAVDLEVNVEGFATADFKVASANGTSMCVKGESVDWDISGKVTLDPIVNLHKSCPDRGYAFGSWDVGAHLTGDVTVFVDNGKSCEADGSPDEFNMGVVDLKFGTTPVFHLDLDHALSDLSKTGTIKITYDLTCCIDKGGLAQVVDSVHPKCKKSEITHHVFAN